jgi:hypothetical protein
MRELQRHMSAWFFDGIPAKQDHLHAEGGSFFDRYGFEQYLDVRGMLRLYNSLPQTDPDHRTPDDPVQRGTYPFREHPDRITDRF